MNRAKQKGGAVPRPPEREQVAAGRVRIVGEKPTDTVSTARDSLPHGWASATIGDICDLNPRLPDAPKPSTEISFVPMAAVSEHTGTIVSPQTRKFREVSKGYTQFRDGDVIWAKITPCMENGKAAVAHNLINGIACGSTEFFVLRSTGAVLPEFIYKFIRQVSYRNAAARSMSGAVGQARVTKNFLNSTPFALPPLAEQRRIVARLKKLAARSRRARAALDAVPQMLAQARQSLLAAAFRGELTKDWREKNKNLESGTSIVKILEAAHDDAGGHKRGNAAQATEGVHNLTPADFPKTWGLTDLLNLCSPGKPVTYGILMPGPDQPNGVPYVRVADYPGEVINLKTVRRTTKEIESNFARARLNTGDLLLSIRGTVGRMAIVPPELHGANITQDTVRLSITDEVETAFVEYILRAPATLTRMQKATKGVAVRGINVGDIRALQIPIPPLPEQREIVSRLKRAFARLDAAAAAHAAAVAELDRLDESLLARAFTGQLVPQNPKDEPAAKLLDRLRVQTLKL